MSAATDHRTPVKRDRFAQLESHARLLRDISQKPLPSRLRRPDAIIVPATRPASALDRVIAVAAELDTYLVVLCSLQADPNRVTDRLRRAGARGLAVELGPGFRLPVGLRSMSGEFDAVNAKRTSDLSAKRNFGLLLARRCRWEKVVFIDDDISTTAADVGRLVHQLNAHQVAGMACRQFPDNSVLCHARREAGFDQDVFVTGAVLGVNCAGETLPFFPDIYNEDWFFFGEAAARQTLTKVGEARQERYNPFADNVRAVHEEFGDLLAEGLYLLMENLGPTFSFRQVTHLADAEFWDRFIRSRRRSLDEARTELDKRVGVPSFADLAGALESLDAADERYVELATPITPDRCVQFLDAWRHDDAAWRGFVKQPGGAVPAREAVALLGAESWAVA
jgi:hypothetical protein